MLFEIKNKKLSMKSFRKSEPQCPYGKKCTYGNKCKFYHPERGLGPHKSVTERLSEHAARHLSAWNSDGFAKTACSKSLSVPLSSNTSDIGVDRRKPLSKFTFDGKSHLFYIICLLIFIFFIFFLFIRSGRTRSCVHDCCTGTGCYDSMVRSRTTPKCSDQSDNSNNFTESSCSLDNSRLSIVENTHQNVYGMHTQQPTIRPTYDHYTHHSVGSNQSNHNENRDLSRAHPKLRRQLSLNPNGYDPRIQSRGQSTNVMNRQMTHADQQPQHGHHRLLSASRSGPRSQNIPNQWDVHHQVSCIW